MGTAPYLFRVEPIETLGDETPRTAEQNGVRVARVFSDPLSDGRPASVEMAQTLVASPYFKTIPGVLAVFRAGSGLAVIGKLSQKEADRLAEFEAETLAARHRIRIFTYADVEEHAATLARRLQAELGDRMADANFVAIPRGGAIVLGILSYLLNLKGHQLTPPFDYLAPMVVVDDCSLSGTRFQEAASAFPGDAQLVFAPLLSHPELRARLLAREPRVAAVVSALDIEDRAPSILGEDYERWLGRWGDRDVGGYWVGIPEHVVFPWSEPDTAVWDAASETTVCGWRAAPPKDCLKNRVAFEQEAHRLVVCVPNEQGAYSPPPQVLYADVEDRFIVAHLRTREVWEFDGAAGAFWNALTQHPTLELAARALSEEFDLTPAELTDDLSDFAEEVTKLGVLDRRS